MAGNRNSSNKNDKQVLNINQDLNEPTKDESAGTFLN